MGVHVKAARDMEFLHEVASTRELVGDERHLWVIICAPTAASACHMQDALLSALPAVHLIPAHRYSETEALALLSMCDRQLVTDALSWWAAYLSTRERPRALLHGGWDITVEDEEAQEWSEVGMREVDASLRTALDDVPAVADTDRR